MLTRRRVIRIVALAVLISFVVVGLLAAARVGPFSPASIGPVPLAEFNETRWMPVAVAAGDGGDDARMMTVEFPWPHDGYCSGQFTVNVTETPTEVRVGQVVSQEPNRGQACGGIGTNGTFAVTFVRLAIPLGGRAVVRAGDSQPLPVLPLARLYQG